MARKNNAPGFFDENGSWELIKRLILENFNDSWPRYAMAIFFMVLVAGATALSAWIMSDVVESLFIERDLDRIKLVAGSIVVIFTVKGVATYLQIITLAKVGNGIVAKLQMRIYDAYMKQSGNFYLRYPSHDMVTRLSNNAQGARRVIELIITSFGRDLLTLVGLIVVMILKDPLLAFLALVIAPPIIFTVASLVRRVRKVAHQRFLSSKEVINVFQDTSKGIQIIKAFEMEGQMRERMGSAVEHVANRNNKVADLIARTSPVMETLGGICVALMIFYAGWKATSEGQTPADFMAFLTALLLAYEPAKRLARLQLNLEDGLVGARLMYEILDAPVDVLERENAKPLQVTDGAVTLKNISFKYPSAVEDAGAVIDGVSFTAEGGSTTALVGPSGGGKTTLMHLIQRFYDVDAGTIEIDGQNIADATIGSLRSPLALVSQDIFLFNGTVKQNILAGRPSATDEDIEAAARDAHAHDFIIGLENGYDTMLGENGAGLSGGQRQRLAIARAILKDARVVLLDEATSALDAESEKLVQDAFDRLKKGRTTIVIAHRLATIRNADCIHVLKDGKVLESGRHDQLIKMDGLYQHLHQLQFSGGSDGDGH